MTTSLSSSLRHPFAIMLLACIASVSLYAACFTTIIHKPLTIGAIHRYLTHKLDYARSITGPKLVILAGSGGRYGHRCELLERELGRACVNGAINAHVAMDLLFYKFKPLLHPGDAVYMPLEYDLYLWQPDKIGSLPSTAYLFEYEPDVLMHFGARRALNGLFYFDPSYLFSGIAEMLLDRAGLQQRRGTEREQSLASMNAQGDETGHTAEQARIYQTTIRTARWPMPIKADTTFDQYAATRNLQAFLRWARSHQVSVIGGLSTIPDDIAVPDYALHKLRKVYVDEGHEFLILDNRSQYVRGCFFDTIFHLNEECQLLHTSRLANALKPILGR